MTTSEAIKQKTMLIVRAGFEEYLKEGKDARMATSKEAETLARPGSSWFSNTQDPSKDKPLAMAAGLEARATMSRSWS